MESESRSLRYVLNEREYELLRRHVLRVSPKLREAGKDGSERPSVASDSESTGRRDDHNAAAFRSASRVFVATLGSLKALDLVLSRLPSRNTQTATRSRQPLVASKTRLALSLSSLLFLHTVLFRVFARLRLRLLHERVRSIRERYPKVYAALTSRIAPAIGASLSGLALGICPADQLRVTAAIYVASRALEIGYAAIRHTKVIANKPSWLGSWVLFALAQGQLLHAFVFDRDCFPEAYGSFVLGYTPEYVQRRPASLSPKVVWPRPDDILDALGQMASLRWPPFVSPILQPNNPNTLPRGINSVISPVTSRAHPAIHKLSCALIHPSDPSCFMAYLRHNLIAFPQMAKFYTIYYAAFALLRIKDFASSPLASANRLSESILRSTMAISGSIGAAWGSICLFQTIFPRSFLPKFRFFLGGLLAGLFQLVDRTPAGHMNALYAARTSVNSLWKVGVKHGWWRGIRGGDVWLFVASLALVNVVYDLGKNTAATQDGALKLIKVLRGEVELGLQKRQKGNGGDGGNGEKQATMSATLSEGTMTEEGLDGEYVVPEDA
ncbi:hypothetical protein A1O3_07030 [Capronia epimyces CBS 606.96]|uniref:Transmembrane protein 135 N-terminal domain-containing protein n=1 Tax=Capronia epimyces CBS 606.96 TaxID=1182542 RepID=W9XUR7_9EURO|nr:uncharacterized protein A1O3_07030 [Capronia epimyces CBS 606.96]EXJ80746.1 hypothetical protein A1O3_07030 [Capronia epimyces CBS 606.96]